MTTKVSYTLEELPEGWIIYDTKYGTKDNPITKEFMKETLYDRLKAILPEDQYVALQRCRDKIPAYLQFPAYIVKSDVGDIECTLELHIHRHLIHEANIIVQGTTGTVAKRPLTKFRLDLDHISYELLAA